jgi:endonuclease G
MRQRDLKDKDAVRAAVRQIADRFLDDPNINSVGVGYKVEGGRRTGRLALQFTVDRKVAPEALEAVGTQPIPDQVTANGITFDTDVVERRYSHEPVAVEVPRKDERKRRVDPMVPGVSIANVHVTAGTLGCLVADAASGEVRMLSNWHVLDGDEGRIGDPIVQPGPYDDNRTDGNLCGHLVRSFLGLAGDCAIASLTARRATPEILGLGVGVARLGEPELGDRVVKSGRTTATTYGIVIRLHAITKIDYGGATGEKRISGFDIGPDDRHPAPNGEVSMGGDSGSAWMAVGADGDTAQDMMLGLHFAGETGDEPEHALACYAETVFSKLEVVPLPPAPRPRRARGATVVGGPRLGYDPAFLPGGHRVALPAVSSTKVRRDLAPTREGALVRDYMHFSLAMSRARRFCRWVGWNVDGSGLQTLSRANLRFVLDDAYEADVQVGDELYGKPKNDLDRGHIARRADLLWGTREEAERANRDSFFFTNITPQLDTFNQSRREGLWGELEDAIFADRTVDDLRLSIFGGPLLKDTDFPYRDVLVPRSFWKLIAYVEGGALKAKAYVLTQDDLEVKLEALGLEPFKLYQVSLADLARRTGLKWPGLAGADTMAPSPEALAADGAVPQVRRIERADEIAV